LGQSPIQNLGGLFYSNFFAPLQKKNVVISMHPFFFCTPCEKIALSAKCNSVCESKQSKSENSKPLG